MNIVKYIDIYTTNGITYCRTIYFSYYSFFIDHLIFVSFAKKFLCERFTYKPITNIGVQIFFIQTPAVVSPFLFCNIFEVF